MFSKLDIFFDFLVRIIPIVNNSFSENFLKEILLLTISAVVVIYFVFWVIIDHYTKLLKFLYPLVSPKTNKLMFVFGLIGLLISISLLCDKSSHIYTYYRSHQIFETLKDIDEIKNEMNFKIKNLPNDIIFSTYPQNSKLLSPSSYSQTFKIPFEIFSEKNTNHNGFVLIGNELCKFFEQPILHYEPGGIFVTAELVKGRSGYFKIRISDNENRKDSFPILLDKRNIKKSFFLSWDSDFIFDWKNESDEDIKAFRDAIIKDNTTCNRIVFLFDNITKKLNEDFGEDSVEITIHEIKLLEKI